MGYSLYWSLLAPERNVIDIAGAGLTDAQAADRLGITIAAIRGHWAAIREKLNAVNRVQGMYLAFSETGSPSIEELTRPYTLARKVHTANLQLAKRDAASSITTSNELIAKARMAVERSRHAMARSEYARCRRQTEPRSEEK